MWAKVKSGDRDPTGEMKPLIYCPLPLSEPNTPETKNNTIQNF